jgi:hypothetical protein
MPRRASVLCFGTDIGLLLTRKLVLQSRYDVTAVSTLEDFSKHLQIRAFDLVLFCHSLADDQCTKAQGEVAALSPETPVLSMKTANRGCKVEHEVFSADGPLALLRAVAAELVGTSPSSKAQVSRDPACRPTPHASAPVAPSPRHAVPPILPKSA